MTSTGSSSSAARESAAPAAIVAGLVCCGDEETIGPVASALRGGLSRFAGCATSVLLVDCGSADGTVARAAQALAGLEWSELSITRSAADALELPYHGVPGKARALQAMLARARELGAAACVVFDGSARTVTPRWVERLTGPVVEHAFDFVSPYYHRHPFDGALTKGLVYPLVRALYGVRLRQPAAAEFACSRRVIDHFLDDDVWDRDGAQVGIDLWLTTSAATGDFRLGEAMLGVRAHHGRGEEALDLATTIVQVVGSLFADLERRAARWQRMRGSVPLQRFGTAATTEPPRAPAVDVDRLLETYRLGSRELGDIWTWVLPARAIIELRKLADARPAAFRLDDGLWARVVYDFAVGYRLRVLPRAHLLRSLVPLYSGWLASFILQVRELGTAAVEDRVEELAAAFEAQKPYLISRWRWPERFRTP